MISSSPRELLLWGPKLVELEVIAYADDAHLRANKVGVDSGRDYREYRLLFSPACPPRPTLLPLPSSLHQGRFWTQNRPDPWASRSWEFLYRNASQMGQNSILGIYDLTVDIDHRAFHPRFLLLSQFFATCPALLFCLFPFFRRLGHWKGFSSQGRNQD